MKKLYARIEDEDFITTIITNMPVNLSKKELWEFLLKNSNETLVGLVIEEFIEKSKEKGAIKNDVFAAMQNERLGASGLEKLLQFSKSYAAGTKNLIDYFPDDLKTDTAKEIADYLISRPDFLFRLGFYKFSHFQVWKFILLRVEGLQNTSDFSKYLFYLAENINSFVENFTLQKKFEVLSFMQYFCDFYSQELKTDCRFFIK